MGTRVAWSLLVLAAAGASYAWVVWLPLTGIDTIPTLAAAHVDAISELPSVLLRELRGGAQQAGSYYRPLTLLTYGVESLLWEWDPRGHHATDLALHAAAALAVFWMARLAFGLASLRALLVAGLFVVHPVANEVVPAVSRRQEPLLVVGFALALMGAARLPAPRAWLLTLLGSAVAVLSVERGLVVPGLVFGFLLLQRSEPAAFVARLRRAALLSVPSLLLALGFYALRAGLFGAGGIFFEPPRAARIGAQYLLQLVYPQQLVDLRVPTSLVGALPALAAGLLAAAALVWIFVRSERKGTLLFCAAWIAGYGLLFAIAGQGNSWYPYSAVPALALGLVAVGVEGWGALRSGSRRTWGAVALLAVAVPVASWLLTTPVFARYPAWELAGELSESFLAELERVAAATSEGASVVVINLPGHYREREAPLRVTRSAAIQWPRSIAVWREVRGIGAEVAVLGAAEFVGEVSLPEIEPLPGDRVAIYFAEGASRYAAPDRAGTTIAPVDEARGRGFVFPVPGEGRRTVFVFDGSRLVPRELAGPGAGTPES